MDDLNQRTASDASLSSGQAGTEQDAPAKGLWFKTNLPRDQVAYFEACGRIRGISYTSIIRRVLAAVVEDQLVASILDDDGKPAERRRHEHGPRKAARAL